MYSKYYNYNDANIAYNLIKLQRIRWLGHIYAWKNPEMQSYFIMFSTSLKTQETHSIHTVENPPSIKISYG